MATAVRRQHEPQRVVGDLLAAEINEKKARSVKYQITVAKLPVAREIEEFTFDGTPINETLVRDLARGEFLNQQRNVVLVGGTGTGKTHISVAIARAVIRNGARGRFFNVVDLVNKLETEARAGRAAAPQRRQAAAVGLLAWSGDSLSGPLGDWAAKRQEGKAASAAVETESNPM